MTLPLPLDLTLTAGTDFSATVTVSSFLGAQLGFLNASAELTAYITPMDPAPLFQVSTAGSAAGSLALGVTFPAPAGLAASGSGALEQLGLATVTTGLPPTSATVANLIALAALPTTSYVLGTLAFVSSGSGSYYAFSPDDPSTPNGTTVVAGVGGNWLLAGTVGIDISAASTAALAPYSYAAWALVVTLADGEQVPLLAGQIYVLSATRFACPAPIPAGPSVWTYPVGPSGGPTFTFPHAESFHQFFDTTLGPISVVPDGSPFNGQTMGVGDASKSSSLATNPLSVAFGSAEYEYPPGTFTSGNLVLGAGSVGIDVTWEWLTAEGYWKCLG
jgi:hypothetical protein